MMKIDMCINSKEPFKVEKVLKINSLNTSVIRGYFELGEYYPIIQKVTRGHFVMLDKHFDVNSTVTGDRKIEEIIRVMGDHTSFDIFDVLTYNAEKGYVITKSDYNVELI